MIEGLLLIIVIHSELHRVGMSAEVSMGDCRNTSDVSLMFATQQNQIFLAYKTWYHAEK